MSQRIQWPSPTIKTDDYFRFVKSFYLELAPSLSLEKRNIINFMQLLDEYEQLLQQFNHAYSTQTAGENFCTPIHIGDPAKQNYYSVAWDIQKANDLFAEKKIPALIPPAKIQNTRSIDVTEAMIAQMGDKLDQPIYITIYPPSNTLVVIDGNQRLAIHTARGTAEIKAFLFDPVEHLQFMTDDLSRVRYYIHHNITVLMSYYAGLIEQVYTDEDHSYWNLDDQIRWSQYLFINRVADLKQKK
ncbi:hypothetical protein IC619_000915 [Hazenella sp. IB182353]|uniref:hypothetical protein n=1 Tax=Polycladospora coralii TaxID=2771432 RepID=UPI001746F0D6|nr:hypothetical protein [Polycladospora coralii]MBS7529053.1 hypothetical protein [Polycladospora coralii]